MKKVFFLLTFLLSFATASFAILPCYEPFANSVGLFPTGTAYAPGSPGWHQTNAQGDFWYEINSTGGGPAIYLTNFSLSYPGLPASTGNAIVLTNASGSGMRMTTANPQIKETQSGAKVYYSMIVSLPNIASLSSSTGDYCWGFNNGSGDQTGQPSDFHARVYFKKNGAGYQLGIARTSSVAYDPTVHSTNETLFIVASYEIVTTNSTGAASTTNDICRLWINPATNSFGGTNPPPENTNTIVFTDADEATSPNTFIMANRSTTQPNVLIVDDFRLGTNWAFVTGAVAVKTPPPASASVAFGGTLSLTNVATGSASVAYQWQFNSTNIAGATTSVLTITNMAAPQAGTYSCTASTGIGSPATTTTTVTVTGDPQFVVQPANENAPTGGSTYFTVSAIGTPSLSYQWFENGNAITDGTSVTGTVFSGSHTTNLSLSSISANDNGAQFYCMVTNGVGLTATSSSASLTVQDPVILSGPNNATVNYHGTANFSVVAGGTSPFGYQWYYNGSPLTDGPSPSGSGAAISGSSTSSLSVSGVAYQDSGSSYYVVVTNANNNTVQSPSATLTVIDPYIVTEPTPQTNNAGTTATFTVSASGTPTLSYQWYQNNNPLSDGNTVAGGGTISGSTTATLTINGVTDANAGNYYVSVLGGSAQTINSTTNALVVIDPVTIVQPPASRVERAGDHLAFAVGVTGTAPIFQWQLNGTNIAGATTSSLVLTNIQDANNGTYTVKVANSINTNSASATLGVIDSTVLPLASTNIVVVRIGDGAQAYSGAKGNTIYLDQYTTNGTYVSTLQVPDENVGQAYGTGSSQTIYGSPALLAQGGTGNDSINSMFLTVSTDQQYLNFAAYCEQYPFSGSDVTVGGAAFLRGLASVNAFGFYTLTYTNQGLYNGGNHTIRGTVTLDGTNFWTTGQAGSVGGVKFINTTDTAIATGNGIPTIVSSTTGPRSVQVVNGTLIFSDAAGSPGLYACAGTPEPLSGTVASSQILSEGGVPGGFAFSPDGQTVYIADAQSFGGTNVQAGGIQRWDTNTAGTGWLYSYTIAPLPNGATNGAQGLTVYFPPSITAWGAGVTGAVLYATTYGGTTNSLSQIVDNGLASTATVIATAGPNQGFRGVRFGPSAIPVSIASQPQSQTNFPNGNVAFTVTANGSQPIFYQWEFNGSPIPGATASSFTTNHVSFASGGNYSVIVSNLIPSTVTSANATLLVTAGAPTFTTGVQSYVEGAGDHLAFAPVVAGSTPISAQWYFNSTTNPIPGATNLYLVLTNIQTGQSGNYLLYVANAYGSNNSSGTLTVESSPVHLSGNNIIVARIGDGAQPLSGVTGNTLYLDQYTTNGVYVSSLQVPDEGTGMPYGTGSASSDQMPFGSQALLVAGNNTPANDGSLEGLLSLSADRQTINFAGYCQAYPFTGSDVSTSTGNGGTDWRGVGSVNAFGAYSLVYTNTGLYSGGNHVIHSAVTSDQVNYWTTGEAGSVGIKWITPSFQPANGNGITTVAGSDAGTRHIRIINGNLFFTDSVGNGTSGAGLYEVGGTPTNSSTASLFLAESNSPVDFALSPDQQTIYIADNSAFGGTNVSAGGIERWDASPLGGYTNSYTLNLGSSAGARGLAVDFSAQTSWGLGVTGAKIYATSAEASGNRFIRIVDNGAASAPTTIVMAGSSSVFSGVSFGPQILPVSIASEPQNQTALIGTGAEFSVGVSGTPPFYYQWQFNGTNIAGATSSSLIVNATQAALPGSYTVIVSNLAPSSATSAPASISFQPILSFFGNGSGWSSNGLSGSGLPLYGYNGGSNIVELTQSVGHQASGTFYQAPVYVGGFLATWTYQVVNPFGTIADGMAFVVQNDSRGAAALGDTTFQTGGSLGYGAPGAITNSVALEFDIFTNATGGAGIALDSNGAIGPNTSTAPVDLGSGDPINVALQYLNGRATVTLFDTVNSNTFTTNALVNVPAIVGGQQAFVGFTAADGGAVSTQTVSNFVYISLVDLQATPSGSNLILAWPVGVGGFTLQQSPALLSGNWTPVTNAVNVVNGSNQVVVPITGNYNFYRLVNP